MLMILYVFLQIVGESFPISSSGHVAFLENVYYFFYPDEIHFSIPLWFDYILHFPTIVILLYYFFARFFNYLQQLIICPLSLYPIVKAVFVTDFITAFCYIGRDCIQSFFPLWIGFCITGCALYSLRYVASKKNIESLNGLSCENIILIALAQCASLLPGVSRFGLTFVVARWQGLKNDDAFFYSFIIALPLFAAAATKGLFLSLHHSDLLLYGCSWQILSLSIVSATFLSYYLFKVVGFLVRTNRLWYISYYMFVVSVIVGIYSVLV
jgi:undecaprenyl-diphosphatase